MSKINFVMVPRKTRHAENYIILREEDWGRIKRLKN